MKQTVIRPIAIGISVLSTSAMLMLPAALTQAQTATNSDERWYQVEVTVFAHNNAWFEQEIWPMDVLADVLPRTTRPLSSLMDVLDLPDWSVISGPGITDAEQPEQQTQLATLLQPGDFRLPDIARDPFVALPSSEQGFTDTNRALRASGSYRVLYHNAWRQPMRSASQAVPVWVEGGGQFVLDGTTRHELEGTLLLRFNPGRDRVVLDARLWLSEFSNQAPAQSLNLPELPPALTSGSAQTDDVLLTDTQPWFVSRVIPVLSNREMRSNEFHYVDHPAVGIVVYVFPYEVPPQPVTPAELF
jgi:hypothetical protein